VLVLYHVPTCKFGALGLSRREELAYKDLTYGSLAEVLHDFKRSYERWWHEVLKIRVGLPVDHSPTYSGPVCWRRAASADCRLPPPAAAAAACSLRPRLRPAAPARRGHPLSQPSSSSAPPRRRR